MPWLEPITLRGTHATLVPLTHDHHDDLVEAVRDESDLRRYLEKAVDERARGVSLPFTTIHRASGRVAGSTRFGSIVREHKRVEIGWTWLGSEFQRTALNTECKLMLLTHAFETKDCVAVEFRTHAFNQGSRRGIERLGAKLDGVLRNNRIMPNGTLRDTCVYSIIAGEWPAVRAHLDARLSRPPAPPI